MIISLACLYAPVLFQGSRLGQLRIYTIPGILFCNITNCSSAVLGRKIFEHFSYIFMNFETVFGPQNWSTGHGLNNFEHFKIFTILRRFYLTIDISGAVIFAMQSLRYWFRVKYHLFEKKHSVGFLQHPSDIYRFISNKVANQRHWSQPYKLTTKNQDHCITGSWIANAGCVKEPKMCSQETLLLSFMIYRHIYKYCTTSLSVEPYMAAPYIPIINIFFEEIW